MHDADFDRNIVATNAVAHTPAVPALEDVRQRLPNPPVQTHPIGKYSSRTAMRIDQLSLRNLVTCGEQKGSRVEGALPARHTRACYVARRDARVAVLKHQQIPTGGLATPGTAIGGSMSQRYRRSARFQRTRSSVRRRKGRSPADEARRRRTRAPPDRNPRRRSCWPVERTRPA